MSGIPADPMPGRRWPLHPQPSEWEGLETWVRRIADTYGVSYDTFLKRALGRTGRGARDLNGISEAELARLSVGTGVPIERMRAMYPAMIWARVNELQGGLLTEGGNKAAGELGRRTGRAMSRAARRRNAYATADAGRLARQNWTVYRA